MRSGIAHGTSTWPKMMVGQSKASGPVPYILKVFSTKHAFGSLRVINKAFEPRSWAVGRQTVSSCWADRENQTLYILVVRHSRPLAS